MVTKNPQNKKYIKPSNIDPWMESKKSLADKVKEEFELDYYFDEDCLVFKDGRKIEAARFPYGLLEKLHLEERDKLAELIESHGQKRLFEALQFQAKLSKRR
jgi:hypothetical protein